MKVICYRTWPKRLLSLALLCWSCGNANPNPTTSEDQAKPTPVEIPQLEVTPTEVNDFPLHPLGLSFQMGDFELPNAISHKPIGNGMITEDHHILLTFPSRSQVVKFQAPEFDTFFWGPAATGGNGTPLEQPYLIRQFDGSFFVSEQNSGQVWQLDMSGQTQNVFNLKAPPMALGPQGQGVVFSAQDPSLFIRVDGKGARQQGFYAGPVFEALGKKNMEAGKLWLMADLQSIYVNNPPDVLVHFQANARVARVLHLHLEALPIQGPAWRLGDVKLKNDQYWVLITDTQQSLLLRIRLEGQVQDVWRLPFPADGFDFSSQLFLLYQRSEGRAQTYRVI